MIRTLGKFLKWFVLAMLTLFLLGFLYVWFVVLAKPKTVTNSREIDDHEWRVVPLRGETACSDGSPYSIFTRKGSSQNLIIHFSGGGACWDNITCATPITWASLFDGDVRQLKSFYIPSVPKIIPAILTGLFDSENQSNPFKDWNVVFIPYCTGDLHIGNTINSYAVDGKQFEIRHNGRNNSLAALQWAFDNYKLPGKILVSGESAGAYGSAFWAHAGFQAVA
jgi:Pectinacetylesterase